MTSKVIIVLIAVVVLLAAALGMWIIIQMDTTGRKGSGLDKQFEYPSGDLGKTDPAQITYREADRIKTGFKEVRGLAVRPGDMVYVAGDHAVKVFNDAGLLDTEIGMDGAPRCLAVRSDGTLYVGLRDRVVLYNPDGTHREDWPSLGPDARVTSIAVTDDFVLVADAGSRAVRMYDPSGKQVREIGRKDAAKNVPGLQVPGPHLDVAASSDGLIRVTNPGLRRVEAYTLQGDLELSWGASSPDLDGFCGCCNPTDIAVLADGSIVTSEKGVLRVKVYAPDGKFAGVVAGPEAFTARTAMASDLGGDEALDLAAGTRGRVYVLDPRTAAVRVFVPKESAGQ